MGRVRLNARIRFGGETGEVTEILDEPNSGLAVLQVRGHSFTVPAAFIEAALDGAIELTGVERSKTEDAGTENRVPDRMVEEFQDRIRSNPSILIDDVAFDRLVGALRKKYSVTPKEGERNGDANPTG